LFGSLVSPDLERWYFIPVVSQSGICLGSSIIVSRTFVTKLHVACILTLPGDFQLRVLTKKKLLTQFLYVQFVFLMFSFSFCLFIVLYLFPIMTSSQAELRFICGLPLKYVVFAPTYLYNCSVSSLNIHFGGTIFFLFSYLLILRALACTFCFSFLSIALFHWHFYFIFLNFSFHLV